MKAERLYDVAFDVVQENKSLGVRDKFEAAYDALTLLVDPPFQEDQNGTSPPSDSADDLDDLEGRFHDCIEDLFRTLEKAPSNKFVPSEVRVLKKIGGWHLTGGRLRQELAQVVMSGATRREATLRKFETLWEEFTDFYESLEMLTEAMGRLQVERDTLDRDSDDTEFGAYYPLRLSETPLNDVASELEDLHFHLRWIAEATNLNIGAVRVRAVSSSGLEVFLESPIAIGTGLSVIIRNLTAAWENVEAARKSRQEAADRGLGTELSEEEERQYISDRVHELCERLMGWFEEEDEGRRNEVRNGLTRALEYFADRIDRGVVFQVKVLSSAGEEGELDGEVPEGISRADVKEMGASMTDLEAAREEDFFIESPDLLEAEESDDRDNHEDGEPDPPDMDNADD